MNLPARLKQYEKYFITAGGLFEVDPALLAAIVDRESRGGLALEPEGPAGTGDNGHGHGLMQIDDRSHAAWLAKVDETGTPLWAKPANNIAQGASILADAIAFFRKYRDTAAFAEPLGVAAYNAGTVRVLHAVRDLTTPWCAEAVIAAADSVTTSRNYSSWCLLRRSVYAGDAPTPKESTS